MSEPGRLRGALAGIRPDDLAAHVVRSLVSSRPEVDGQMIDEVLFGDANQAGEDTRDVARMAVLLAGLPTGVPGVTVNRLCASGLEAVIQGSRAIAAGDADVVIAGGVESMSGSPWVISKPERSYPPDHSRMWSTTIGWRMVNPRLPAEWTVALGEGAEIRLGPVGAARTALDRSGIRWADVATVEVNEAFAAQVLACLAEWPDLDPTIVNPQGGAIAIGHPLGCSGARLITTLTHRLVRTGGRYGLAAMCVGVGQGVAVVLENLTRVDKSQPSSRPRR